MSEVCGYKNHATAVCAFALAHDRDVYEAARGFMRHYKGDSPYLDFIRAMGWMEAMIPDDDNHYWVSNQIDYAQLDADLWDI